MRGLAEAVSARRGGGWSAVRVSYTPGRNWGRSAYPAYGFIYPGAGEK